VLNQGNRTPRTSYAATSALDETHLGHYHDMNLCILLHQLDDPAQHEVVKKAVRKAVKTRVKQLGMKYDNEVCPFLEQTCRQCMPGKLILRKDNQAV